MAAQVEWQRLLGVVELSTEGDPATTPVPSRSPRESTPAETTFSRGAVERPAEAPAAIDRPSAGTPLADAPPPARPGSPPAAGEPEVALARSLDGLRGVIGDCHRCRLHGARTQIVFGVGNPRARVVFVGEGPGRDEDLQGEPFVGRAGQLLTDIIEKGMKLSRADVYICNVVKCRPPQNRNPEPEEVATCSPFLFRQIELVAPEVLVTLGKFAAHSLLQTDVPITRLRGEWQEFRGIPVMPTFHPAYLLRNPAEKKTVWQDIKQVMTRLGLPA